MEKITPKGTRVLVSRESPDETEAGGLIVLPEDMKMREFSAETRATVLAVGSMAFLDRDLFKEEDMPEIGEHVIIRRYSGLAVDEDEQYGDVMVNDMDVLAKVDNIEE